MFTFLLRVVVMEVFTGKMYTCVRYMTCLDGLNC